MRKKFYKTSHFGSIYKISVKLIKYVVKEILPKLDPQLIPIFQLTSFEAKINLIVTIIARLSTFEIKK